MSPRILVVYYRPKPGGFSHRLQMKMEACLEAGWEVHYLSLAPFPIQHPNLVFHRMPCPFRRWDTPLFWSWYFLWGPFWVLGVGMRVRPHLVSVFSLPYAWICGLLRKALGVPVVVFLRSLPNTPLYSFKGKSWAHRIESAIESRALRWSDFLIANSKTVLDALRQRFPNIQAKTTVLSNHLPEVTIDRPRQRAALIKQYAVPEEAFIILSTGRLHPGKNLECLIRAMTQVSDPRAVLLVFGEGEQKEALQTLIRSLHLESRVRLAGWSDRLTDLLPGGDLFVLPSLKEGMSNSLLEAMACGLPCLVSAIPENQEVIPSPIQQFPPDRPDMLAERIRQAVTDQEFLENLRRQTQRAADRYRFNWRDRVVETLRPWIQPVP